MSGIIKPGFLCKKDGRWYPVRALNVAVLLYHIHRAAQDDQIGFEDARETLNSITRKLNKTVFVAPEVLESCLWAMNLSNEQGKYWHPRDISFDEFIRDVLKKDSFDKTYNVIVKREKK